MSSTSSDKPLPQDDRSNQSPASKATKGPEPEEIDKLIDKLIAEVDLTIPEHRFVHFDRLLIEFWFWLVMLSVELVGGKRCNID